MDIPQIDKLPVGNPKETFIEEHIDLRFRLWFQKVSALGAFMFIFFSLLDLIVTPENFALFIQGRIAVSLLLVLVSFCFSRLPAGRSQYLLGYFAVVVSAVFMEFMILHFQGHRSSYFAGMILLGICVISFIPSRLSFHILSAITIQATYLFPILAAEQITDLRLFLTNNFFIASTLLIQLFLSHLNYKRLYVELGLRFDMEENNKSMEKYSADLSSRYTQQSMELKNYEIVLNALFENAADGILISDTQGVIANANRRACELFDKNKESLVATDIRDLGSDEARVLWDERLQRMLNNESLNFESEYERKDLGKVFLEVTAKRISIGEMDLIQYFFRDTTDKKRLLSERLHAQRMETMGMLADGIAHDFGNVLTVILAYSDVITENRDVPEEALSHMKIIEDSARRGKHLVSQLLRYAKRGEKEFALISVNKVIEETLSMISRLIPKMIRVGADLSPEAPVIVGNETQIEQVIMNLLINAKDALSGEGELYVSTGVVELEAGALDLPVENRAGRYVEITIRDTGCGIPEERLAKVFTPFFTTKETGTGLGLSIVYGLVKDHGGYVTVKSAVGQGSAFTCYLPVSRQQSGVPGALSPEGRERTNTVLVVDDEMHILSLIDDVLHEHGLQPVTFDNPLSALDFFRKNHGKIDLAIVDIVMPVMDGKSLIKEMRQIDDKVRIILITGFSPKSLDGLGDGLLCKPFTSQDLVTAVDNVLA